MTKIVYIVYWQDRIGYVDIVGVFDTKSAAEQFVKEHQYSDMLEIDEAEFNPVSGSYDI